MPIVLSVNSGSSSLKLALYDGDRRLAATSITDLADHGQAVTDALAAWTSGGFPAPAAVGHRVVHGGPRHFAPARIDDQLVRELRDLVPLAPIHLPRSLAGIDALRRVAPNLPQVACFDTGFHETLPATSRVLPLPFPALRRYGFHGLSYEYVVSTLSPVPARLVIAHLGSGASLCALREGRSIDTTMGMTPTGGIPMSTRTGDLDPGVLLYLMREEGLSADDVSRVVNQESGLLAVGGTANMKELLARDDERATLAVSVFVTAVQKTIGAYAAVLGGIDALVFTGGIGENAARIRAAVCKNLDFLGLGIDDERNERGDREIGDRVLVVRTDEDAMVARHTRRVLAGISEAKGVS